MKPPVRIASRVLFVAVLLGAAGLGCKEKITGSGGDPLFPQYKAATSPENVAYNLQTCYQRRDIDAYGKLLAPEFRFYFQPSAVPQDLGRPYWVHDEDSTHTAILFRTPQVNGIQITLTYGPAIVPPELDMGAAGWMKIHAQAHLEVDDVNGVTYIVAGDFEDFYFRKGLLQNAGEDTASWYLVEWHDIENPGGYGVGAPMAGPAGVEPAAAQETSWGSIKNQYH
jgi:hypothetical protein